MAGDWKAKDRVPLTVAAYRDEALASNCRIMMEPLLDKMDVLNDVVERIGSYLVEKNELQAPTNNRQVSPVCLLKTCLIINMLVFESNRPIEYFLNI